MAHELRESRNNLLENTDFFYEDLKNNLMQGCLTKLKELHIEINNQQDENARLAKDCNDLKKECSQLQQLMLMVGKRLSNLEAAVGSYGPKTGKRK